MYYTVLHATANCQEKTLRIQMQAQGPKIMFGPLVFYYFKKPLYNTFGPYFKPEIYFPKIDLD